MTDKDILAAIIRNEGGYVDHPDDLGGPTNMGITALTLGEWRRLGRPATRDEVRTLTRGEAEAIYAVRYLQPFAALKTVDEQLRHYCIDLGVLRGPRRAAMVLQEIVGADADGWIGPKTLAAIRPLQPHVLVMMIGSRFTHIEGRIKENSTQKVFRNGWRNRNRRFLP